MLSSDWVYAEYSTALNSGIALQKKYSAISLNSWSFLALQAKRHLVFVYHTTFQQKSAQSTWSDMETQQEIANAFLNFMDFKPWP